MGKHNEEIARLQAKHKPANAYDHCYDEGFAARVEGFDVQACPYAIFTLEERYWLAGWDKARTRAKRKDRYEPEPDEDGGITIL